MLLLSVGILGVLIFLVVQEYRRGQAATVEVVWLSPNQFLVRGDTTNFDQLASTLREEATYYRQQGRRYEFELNLPPQTANSDTLRAVIQLMSAFDVPWHLKQ